MTDFDPTLDELVSAYLDGATSADETARVEADATLVARVAELRRVRDAIGRPVTPPTVEDRDRLIASVLDEFTAQRPTALITARRRWRPPVGLAAAAAFLAVAFLAGTLVLLARDSSSGGREASTAASATTAGGGALNQRNPDSAGSTPGLDAKSPTALSRSDARQLGSFADLPELRAHIAAAGQLPPSSAGEAFTTMPECPGTDPSATRYGATVAGRVVVVLVTETRVTVLDASCRPIDDFPR